MYTKDYHLMHIETDLFYYLPQNYNIDTDSKYVGSDNYYHS